MQDNPAARHQLRVPRDIARMALAAFGMIAAGVTVIAVTESYSNLLAFALAYGLSGWRAAIAPAAVDSFIIMGELLLFAAILLAWGRVPHILGAGMAVWGFALSVGGNVWHAAAATVADRAVAAIWPVTATAGLAGGLIIVRQIMTPDIPVTPPGRDTGMLPQVPARRELHRAPPARKARRGPGPAVPVDEQELLAELLASGKPLPSLRALSLEKTGLVRSRPVERVLGTARAQVNGSGYDGGG